MYEYIRFMHIESIESIGYNKEYVFDYKSSFKCIFKESKRHMKKKLALLFVFIICIGLIGYGSQASEDTQEVSALTDTEPSIDAEEIDETASAYQTESDEKDLSAVTDNEADIDAETDSAEQVNADNSETGENPEVMILPEYEVTAFEEPTVMYASDSIRVRQGPSTDYEIIGFVNLGWDVTVTGQADTGWYEILYNKEKAFVSNEYLLNEKPAEEPALQAASETDPVSEADPISEADPVSEADSVSDDQPQETAETTPVTEVKDVAGVILVGDSRFVQMKNSVGENSCTWIAEGGKGYKWFHENAVARIDDCVGEGSKILINLGVNDPGNLRNYLTLVNAKAEEWTSKGATVYYASVNPVWESRYVTEEQVQYFNSQLQNGLSDNVHWIDSHDYLISIGYELVDGLHYSKETYRNLYAYYMSCM